jgi:serine/threonine protein kinase
MEVEYERQLDLQKERIWELQQSLWSYVSACFPEFPELRFEGPAEMEPGEKIGDCTIHQRIGAGRMSKVYSARNAGMGRNEAVKAIEKANLNNMREVQDVFEEVRLLGKLQHKNVVHLHEFVHTDHFLLIHMELAGSRNLFRFMCDTGGRLAVKLSRHLASQLAQALAYCHHQGVAHCDVKPENVVLSKDGQNAKLVDFGFAVESSNPCSSIRGTMPFVAPEVLLEDAVYDPAPVDIWSFGVLVLEMLCGLRKLNRMMEWTKDEPPHARLHGELTEVFNQLGVLPEALEEDGIVPERPLVAALQGALTPSPRTRWTAAQLESSEWLSASGPPPAGGAG